MGCFDLISFFLLLIFICIGCLGTSGSFIKCLILAEIIWIDIFFIVTYLSTVTDDCGMIQLALYSLGLASLEIAVGLILGAVGKSISSKQFNSSKFN